MARLLFPRALYALISLLAANFLHAQPTQAAAWSFPAAERVVAIGDVHGAWPELLAVLRGTGLIDEQNRWQGGKTHLVSVGDLLDRGADSRRVMELLMRLQEEAIAAGGRLHVVPGNHEVMNITSDLRYVSLGEYAAFAAEEDPRDRAAALQDYLGDHALDSQAEAAARERFAAEHPPGFFAHRKAFSLSGRYGRWIDGLPYVLRIGDTVFVHGGLSAAMASQPGEQLNARMHEELSDYLALTRRLINEGLIGRLDDYGERFDTAERLIAAQAERQAAGAGQDPDSNAAPVAAELLVPDLSPDQVALLQAYAGMQSALIFRVDGPLWYRGNAWCHPLWESGRLASALDNLGARRVVVGHTPTPTRRITGRLGERLLMIDTGMLPYYDGRASALEITRAGLRAYYADQNLWTEPDTEVRSLGTRPAGVTDEDLELFLADAEITGSEALGMGVTKPRRLTLSKDDLTLRAVFKGEDTDTSEGTGTRRDTRLNISDSYRNDIAAYRLDKFLGIDLIPVTVAREFSGESGSLQFWVENSISDLERRQQNVAIYPACDVQEQYDLMRIFDVLIYNEDRNQSNVLFDRDKGLVRLIDHSRAFRTHRGRPPVYENAPLRIPEPLAERLAALDRDTLHELVGDLLQKKQLRAILKRRDEILRQGVVVSGRLDEKGIAD